jgi:hypothetical protein
MLTRPIREEPLVRKLVEQLLSGNIAEVKPFIDLSLELGFTYPQIEELLSLSARESHKLLEELTANALLEKHPYSRLLFCPECQSPNMKAGDGCPKCYSWNIARGRILEHLQCGNLSLEEEYITDDRYICPKCHKELKFLGTDYQSLGINYKCHSCNSIFSQPLTSWHCLNCSRFFLEKDVSESFVYSYRLNEEKRRWLEFELGPKERLLSFLRRRGYEVAENAIASGTSKSGTGHTFDIVARRDDGFITHTTAIDALIDGRAPEVGLERVFNYDNKTYDLGIHDKVLIVIPRLSPPARQFALRQKIRLFEDTELEGFLASPASASTGSPSKAKVHHPKFKSKTQLIDHLKATGYRVEEQATIQGRSGATHRFNVLAYYDDGILTHTLAIGIFSSDTEVGFDTVSSFDTRAYDANIHDKAILVYPRLSTEARQFADYQRIRVIEVDSADALK